MVIVREFTLKAFKRSFSLMALFISINEAFHHSKCFLESCQQSWYVVCWLLFSSKGGVVELKENQITFS